MYRDLIVLGHRPPLIDEKPGPKVRTLLIGGEPVMPVVKLIQALRPTVRQRDINVAVIIYHLLHNAFITRQQAAQALQTDSSEADIALASAEQTTVNGEPLIVRHSDVWLFGKAAVTEILSNTNAALLARRNLLMYHRAGGQNAKDVVGYWLTEHSQITSGDFAALTGVAPPNATRTLNGMIGSVLVRGAAIRGRNAHFLPMPTDGTSPDQSW